jgi:hypothetical protein
MPDLDLDYRALHNVTLYLAALTAAKHAEASRAERSGRR